MDFQLSCTLILNSFVQDFSPGLLGRGWCLNEDGVSSGLQHIGEAEHTHRKWTETERDF